MRFAQCGGVMVGELGVGKSGCWALWATMPSALLSGLSIVLMKT